jgi:hypothetical protein
VRDHNCLFLYLTLALNPHALYVFFSAVP